MSSPAPSRQRTTRSVAAAIPDRQPPAPRQRAGVTDADKPARAALVAKVAALVEQRFDPAVRDGCGAAHRVLTQTLLTRDLPALEQLAHAYQRVAVRVRAAAAWERGRWVLDLDGAVHVEGEVLRCDPRATPGPCPAPCSRPPITPTGLDEARDAPDVELALVSRNWAESFGLERAAELGVAANWTLAVCRQVKMDPAKAAAGRPLEDGLWASSSRCGGRARWLQRPGVPRAGIPVPPPSTAADGQVLIPFVAGRTAA